MTKFNEEFRKFINRGNVVDMAVGIIVGSSFTAIVNALCNSILKPLTNFILSLLFGVDSMSEIYTFLQRVDKQEEILNDAGEVIDVQIVPDLEQSIYIDWGAFINAVISFLLIALVLFCIVKFINKVREEHREFVKTVAEKTLDRHERRELRAAGVNIRDKKAVQKYFSDKKKKEEDEAKRKEAEAAEAARLERLANPTSEDLLKEILAEMKVQKKS